MYHSFLLFVTFILEYRFICLLKMMLNVKVIEKKNTFYGTIRIIIKNKYYDQNKIAFTHSAIP